MRGNQVGFQRDRALERAERLRFVPTHCERHPEIHQESRLVRKRLQQFAIHPRGLVEPAVAHRL